MAGRGQQVPKLFVPQGDDGIEVSGAPGGRYCSQQHGRVSIPQAGKTVERRDHRLSRSGLRGVFKVEAAAGVP